jgi:hypothetical protein
MENVLNFGGFYESYHSDRVDSIIELFEVVEQNVNYKETYLNYSKCLVSAINSHLDIEMSFISLDSPKYYNYSTDKIIVDINKKDILKLFKYIKENDLKKEVIDKIVDVTTSKSGYVAFYQKEDFFKKENLNFLVETILEIIYDYIEEDVLYSFDFEIIE